MKRVLLAAAVTVLALGCARVRVEAPKEPIKIDVSMRLDIYQHVSKDINDIESLVGSTPQNSTAADKRSMLQGFISLAYAEEGLSPEVEQAAYRRRDRVGELRGWEVKGVLGENARGMVEIRESGSRSAELEELVKKENSDRAIIYKSIAEKNGTPISEVEKLYAQRLQQDAPAGTPVQAEGGWRVK